MLWPPYKLKSRYEQALKQEEPAAESWTPYGINRSFFITVTSDLQSTSGSDDGGDNNEEVIPSKRIKRSIRRLSYEYGSNIDESEELTSKYSRPPKLKQSYHKLSDKVEKGLGYSQTRIIPSSPTTSTSTVNTLTSQSPLVWNAIPNVNIENSSGNSVFNKKLLGLLGHINEQNKQILELLRKGQQGQLSSHCHPFPELPVKIPLISYENLQSLETHLENQDNLTILALYFSTLGGEDLTTKTNYILRRLLANQLASEYNFFGK